MLKFSVNLRWAVCVGPILFHGEKYSQQFWCFLEPVLTSKAFLTPHFNQSDSCPPAYSPRKGAGHICSSFGNPEKVLYDDKYPVKTGTKSFSITTIIQNKKVICNETNSELYPLLFFFFTLFPHKQNWSTLTVVLLSCSCEDRDSTDVAEGRGLSVVSLCHHWFTIV